MYSVIITAAGKGSRMNLGYNKMLHKFKDKLLIEYSLDLFTNNPLFDEIILVINHSDVDIIEKIIHDKYSKENIKLVLGGKERQDSVYSGLSAASNDWVFVHDGARIYLTDELISRLDNKIKSMDDDIVGVALAVKSIDTTLLVENDKIISKLNRDNLYLMQTPQVSKRKKIMSVIEKAKKENVNYTDEMSAFIANNMNVHIVNSEYYNKKMTTIEDLKES